MSSIDSTTASNDNNTTKNSNDTPDKSVDIWRDSPIRYMGYANEVGEAFRHIYPKYVRPSYAVAFLYVGCDTIDKTLAAFKKSGGRNDINSLSIAAKVGLDAFIWQTFASVLIPGKIIHLVASTLNYSLNRNSSKYLNSTHYKLRYYKIPPVVKLWAPTVAGLAVIPLIVHPIDVFVDYCMDNSVRKLLGPAAED